MPDAALDFGALCWPRSTAALCLDELRLRPSRTVRRRATGAKPESPLISVVRAARVLHAPEFTHFNDGGSELSAKLGNPGPKKRVESRNESAMSFRISKGRNGHNEFRRPELPDGPEEELPRRTVVGYGKRGEARRGKICSRRPVAVANCAKKFYKRKPKGPLGSTKVSKNGTKRSHYPALGLRTGSGWIPACAGMTLTSR